MRVLISGYYGFGNVGDEAVLQSMVQGLRRVDPSIEITVLSVVPQLTKELNQVNAIHRFDWKKIFFTMLRTDVFVSGGGTLLQNATSTRSFLYYIGLILLAKFMRKRVVIFAQGFGPLKGIFSRTLARMVLNRVDLITLRDRVSYREIARLGVRKPKIYVTADPSLILKTPPVKEGQKVLGLEGVRSGRPLLGIAVRDVPRNKEEKIYKSLAQVIDWLAQEHKYSPVFVLFQCPQDMQETSKVINHMQEKSSVIFRMCRPEEMLALISNFDLLIGMRLHSLIFAAMNQVPMLGIAYDPKVRSFMKKIEQRCLSLNEGSDHRHLKVILEKIHKNKREIASLLRAKKKGIFDQASLNFSVFADYLKPRPKLQETKK